MSLKLYFHPLASFCHKVLIALYENDTPFEGQLVDLADATSRAEFLKVWPIGKFPVLRDEGRVKTIPESTIIIEYLAQNYPGRVVLVPQDPELAWQARLRDRFYDLYGRAGGRQAARARGQLRAPAQWHHEPRPSRAHDLGGSRFGHCGLRGLPAR